LSAEAEAPNLIIRRGGKHANVVQVNRDRDRYTADRLRVRIGGIPATWIEW